MTLLSLKRQSTTEIFLQCIWLTDTNTVASRSILKYCLCQNYLAGSVTYYKAVLKNVKKNKTFGKIYVYTKKQ